MKHKRILATILTAILLIGSLQMTVFADELSADGASEMETTVQGNSAEESAPSENAGSENTGNTVNGNESGFTYTKKEWDGSKVVTTRNVSIPKDQLKEFTGKLDESGWYYVSESRTISERGNISAGKDVHLVLADGVTVEYKKGIHVAGKLSIYGQTDDREKMGMLIATGEEYQSGIGGNKKEEHGHIYIYGGHVSATGGDYGAGIGTGDEAFNAPNSRIYVYGGFTEARGGKEGAGLGGGNESCCGDIHIYGGTISANALELAPGIGNGDSCSIREYNKITIDGGFTYAINGKYAACIGSGNYSTCPVIVINDGVVETTTSHSGVGIGAFSDKDADITINGGAINTKCFSGAASTGIGGSSSKGTRITISGGEVTALSADGGAGIGSRNGDFCGTVIIKGGRVRADGSTYEKKNISGKKADDQDLCGGAGIGAATNGNMEGTIEISGGDVTVVGGKGAAAIGAGNESDIWIGGECTGSVTVDLYGKSVLKLRNGELKDGSAAQCIGCGADGSDEGCITLNDYLQVIGADGKPVKKSERWNTLRSDMHEDGKFLTVKACDHADKTYSCTETHHKEVCQYCDFIGSEEVHEYEDGKCRICGYEARQTCWVVYQNNGGSGYKFATLLKKGSMFELPDCPFRAPSGKRFAGWDVNGVTMQPNEKIRISEDTYLVARWEGYICGHSVTLSREIGVNFFVALPKDASEYAVSFTWGTGEKNIYTIDTELSVVPSDSEAYKAGARSVASCGVPARNMTDTIHMTISEKASGKVVVTDEYRVVDYIGTLAVKTSVDSHEYDLQLHKVMKAMLIYGAEAQKYFKYRTDDLATDYLSGTVENKHYEVVDNDDNEYTRVDRFIRDYSSEERAKDIIDFFNNPEDLILTIKRIEDDNIGLKYYAAAVSCKSKTVIKLYFDKTENYDIKKLRASFDGRALNFKEAAENRVCLEISGLEASDVELTHEISINGKTYVYNATDYMARCVLNSSEFAPAAVALMAFSRFAAEYRMWHN